MKIFGKQFWPFGQKDASLPLQSSFSVQSNSSGRRVSNRELYNGWVSACVKAIAEEVGRIELVLYKRKGKDVVVLEQHPAIDLLKYVNEFFTQYNLFERLQANLEVGGNEYWFLEKNKKGIPYEIYPLAPEAVTPHRGKYYVDYYEYRLDDKTYKLTPDQVIHFKTFNPYSDIIGMSTIESARVTIETDVFSKEYNRKFYINDATPSGILSTPDELDVDAATRVKDKWNESFGGFKRAFKTAILTGGMTYTSIAAKHADMQFIEQSKMNRDDILAMFRVPKTILGIVEDVNYASAKASNYIFSLRCIFPREARIVDIINEFYVPLFGDEDIWFGFKSPVQEDILETTQVNQILFMNGQLTMNEWRKRNGLAPIENGDQVFLPFSLNPYGKPVEQKDFDSGTTLTKLSHEIKEAVLANLHTHQGGTCDHCGEGKAAVPHNSEQIIESNGKRFQLRLDPRSFEDLGQKINNSTRAREAPYIKQMEVIMNRIFDLQAEEAVRNVRSYLKKSAKSQKDLKAKLPEFIDIPKQVKVTIDLVTPILSEFFGSEGQYAFATLGLAPEDFSLDAPNVRKYLEASIKKFAGEVTDHTSAKIRQQIADGLESDEGVQAISSRIRDLTALSNARSELIAITEIHRAQGHAELQAWAESGVVVAKIWYTALDERVCEECSMMHGTEVDLEDAFASASDLTEMGFQSYDGPVDIAQLHPRCRCSIIPVVKG